MKECLASFTVNIPYTHFDKGERVKINPLSLLVQRRPEYKDKIFTVNSIILPTSAKDYDAFVILDTVVESVPSSELELVDKEPT